MKCPPESELAKDALSWLRDQGWECYQEVLRPGGAADIVATRGKLVAVVECKKHLGVDVLEQCYRWLPDCHFVWAACWRSNQRSNLLANIAETNGIGVVFFDPKHRNESNVREHPEPRFRRLPPGADALRAALAPQHQSGYQEAGTNNGRRWTPYQMTLYELRNIVKEQPGITLKAAIDGIRHHYSSTVSARQSLRHWLDEGKVLGLRLEKQGKALLLFPTPMESVLR